jgi:hypothetical protein
LHIFSKKIKTLFQILDDIGRNLAGRGKPEVADLDVIVRVQEDVGRLQVPAKLVGEALLHFVSTFKKVFRAYNHQLQPISYF